MSLLTEAARLNDPYFYGGDPYPVYSHLRREAPVYWFEDGLQRFWAISKYQDIKWISTKPELFSSSRGILVLDQIFHEAFGQSAGDFMNPPGSKSVILCDPPVHSQVRRLVSKAFTPRVVQSMELTVRSIVRRTLDKIVVGEPFDFVETVAIEVPMFVLGEMLGVPRERRNDFTRWADNSVEMGCDVTLDMFSRFYEIQTEMWEYFAGELNQRESDPRDDLLTGLATAEIDGERLSPPNQQMMCATLLGAGNETTRNLFTGGLLALAENPDQTKLLVEDRSLMSGATDELLRWATPIHTFARTATADTEIRGQEIKTDDYILLLYGSGNRDEEIWPNADELDVTRPLDPMHIAFGWGEHLCLGSNLARLEMRILLEEFLDRFPRFSLAGDPVKKPSSLINGYHHLPLVVHP